MCNRCVAVAAGCPPRPLPARPSAPPYPSPPSPPQLFIVRRPEPRVRAPRARPARLPDCRPLQAGTPRVRVLHVPKTAGCAVHLALSKGVAASPAAGGAPVARERHGVLASACAPGDAVALFVRHPFDRFESAFWSRQRQGKPKFNYPHTPLEAQAFAMFPTPSALATALRDTGRLGRLAQDFCGAGAHFQPQASYALAADGATMRADFVGCQEDLANDYPALLAWLGVPPSDAPPLEMEHVGE